jgi:beta-phosphoglucomutase
MAILFDMDGVIVDSNPVHRDAWRIYNRRFGIETDEAMQQRMYGKRNDDIVRDFFGPQVTAAEVRAHGAAKERLYREMMADRIHQALVPGVVEFLDRHRGTPKALATNAEPANVDFVLDAAGLRAHFDVIVDGDQVKLPKPHPQIFLRAAELLRVAAGDCIVFEDSLAGIEAARRAGMRPVGVRTTHAVLPDADLTIDDFRSPELEPWLGRQIPHR